VEIKITGFKEIDKALSDLEPKLGKKIIRSSMREGLRITLDKVKQLAPVSQLSDTEAKARKVGRDSSGRFVSRGTTGGSKAQHKPGLLRKMLKIRAAKSKKRGTITLRVMTGKKDYQGEAFYASMVEWGTVKQPAQGFMRRGLETTAQGVIAKTNQKIKDGINEVVRWWRRV
jgi:HK97 gp10 family phage protein